MGFDKQLEFANKWVQMKKELAEIASRDPCTFHWSDPDLLKHVKHYLLREDVEKYPLVQEGIYQLVGGFGFDDEVPLCAEKRQIIFPDLVEGRFVDTIAFLVNQWAYVSYGDPSRNGYVVQTNSPKINPRRLVPVLSLDVLLD